MFRVVHFAAKFIHEAIISPLNVELFIREANIATSLRYPISSYLLEPHWMTISL